MADFPAHEAANARGRRMKKNNIIPLRRKSTRDRDACLGLESLARLEHDPLAITRGVLWTLAAALAFWGLLIWVLSS
jgi:hypothetical protein